MNTADWIVIGEFFLAWLALVAFVVGYAASTRGRALRTPEGRHLINFRGSLAVFMILGVVNNLVLDYPGRDAARVLIIGWFCVAALQGDWLMIRAQRRRRRERKTAAPTHRSTHSAAPR